MIRLPAFFLSAAPVAWLGAALLEPAGGAAVVVAAAALDSLEAPEEAGVEEADDSTGLAVTSDVAALVAEVSPALAAELTELT